MGKGRSVHHHHLAVRPTLRVALAVAVLVGVAAPSQAAKRPATTAKSKAATSAKKTKPAVPVMPAVKAPTSADPKLTKDVSNAYTQLGAPENIRKAIGAEVLLDAGIDGSGIDVAVLDSGVASVPGLDGPNKLAPGVDTTGGSGGDPFGHGTHMAGIIAADDPSSGFRGIAPKARIVPIKVADALGNTDARQVIAGVEWVVENAKTGGRNIRVINLSLAAVPLESYVDDPLAVALERAWDAGIFVVTSAGNGGVGPIASPAYDPYFLTVGAIDPRATPDLGDDKLADFTSGTTDPTARRIDVAVPGVSVLGLRSPGSTIDANAGAGIVDDRVLRGSGTSQAAAVASGAAALLFQKFPKATPDQMKALLRDTAISMDGDRPRSGAGRLRVDRAVEVGLRPAKQTWPLAVGLPTVQVDAKRPSLIKIASGFVTAAPGATGNTWTGNTWTGNTWTGSTWTGSAWTGSTWTGSTWTGSTWSGSTWTGSTWTGSTWTGSTWTGSTWS